MLHWFQVYSNTVIRRVCALPCPHHKCSSHLSQTTLWRYHRLRPLCWLCLFQRGDLNEQNWHSRKKIASLACRAGDRKGTSAHRNGRESLACAAFFRQGLLRAIPVPGRQPEAPVVTHSWLLEHHYGGFVQSLPWCLTRLFILNNDRSEDPTHCLL